MQKLDNKPYIGVTGLTSRRETNDVLHAIGHLDGTRSVMCGVILSKARMENRPARLPHRYPATSQIPGIFRQKAGVLNIIHYRPQRADAKSLIRALAAGGANCNGIQINSPVENPWPRADDIARLWHHPKTQRVILQVGQPAMTAAGGDRLAIAERCKPYDGIVTDILVDQSAGTAQRGGIDQSILTAAAISAQCPNIRVGFAGGLSKACVNRYAREGEAAMRHTNFNIDAEGGLRTEDDRLSISLAAEYVRTAMRTFQELNSE